MCQGRVKTGGSPARYNPVVKNDNFTILGQTHSLQAIIALDGKSCYNSASFPRFFYVRSVRVK
jgi:hypothetical protein